jgi:hypothetical protein
MAAGTPALLPRPADVVVGVDPAAFPPPAQLVELRRRTA